MRGAGSSGERDSEGRVPEPFAAYMRTQFSIIRLALFQHTRAYATGSRKLLLQALLLDPCVDSVTAAESLLDDMLELQKEFLPVFTWRG